MHPLLSFYDYYTKTPTDVAATCAEEAVNYKTLGDRVAGFSHLIQSIYCVQTGDKVIIHLRPSINLIVASLSAISLDLKVIFISTSTPSENKSNIIKREKPKLIIQEINQLFTYIDTESQCHFIDAEEEGTSPLQNDKPDDYTFSKLVLDKTKERSLSIRYGGENSIVDSEELLNEMFIGFEKSLPSSLIRRIAIYNDNSLDLMLYALSTGKILDIYEKNFSENEATNFFGPLPSKCFHSTISDVMTAEHMPDLIKIEIDRLDIIAELGGLEVGCVILIGQVSSIQEHNIANAFSKDTLVKYQSARIESSMELNSNFGRISEQYLPVTDYDRKFIDAIRNIENANSVTSTQELNYNGICSITLSNVSSLDECYKMFLQNISSSALGNYSYKFDKIEQRLEVVEKSTPTNEKLDDNYSNPVAIRLKNIVSEVFNNSSFETSSSFDDLGENLFKKRLLLILWGRNLGTGRFHLSVMKNNHTPDKLSEYLNSKKDVFLRPFSHNKKKGTLLIYTDDFLNKDISRLLRELPGLNIYLLSPRLEEGSHGKINMLNDVARDCVRHANEIVDKSISIICIISGKLLTLDLTKVIHKSLDLEKTFIPYQGFSNGK